MKKLLKSLRWAVSTVVCGDCGRSWVAVRPIRTPVEVLQCPSCGQQGHTREKDHDNEEDLGV